MRSHRFLYSIGFLIFLLISAGVYIYHDLSLKKIATNQAQAVSHPKETKAPENKEVVPATENQPVTEMKQSTVTNANTSSMVSNVPFIQQLPELERGCEVTSLAMLLQSAGVSVDKMTLAKEISTVPFMENDDVRGNPNDGFVGDIYSLDNSGYGVYHGPIFQLEQQYLPSRAVDLTGKDVKDLYTYIDKGAPVWVITNSTFAPLSDDEFTTWNTNDGDVKITYSEHSVVIVGYDEQNVYINDPLADGPKTAVPRQAFEQAWVQMGSQAISYTQ